MRRFSPPPVAGIKDLEEFISGGSAFVAQSSLYGYVKTRAGFEYFRMFDNPEFVASLNIAKWNIFADCVGDLTMFCAAHIRRRTGAPDAHVARMAGECARRVFAAQGSPAEAGPDYPAVSSRAQARIDGAEWAGVRDDETPFSRSPEALVYWAPISDRHKEHDAAIVRNSIVFMWKKKRDDFRRRLRPDRMRESMRRLAARDGAETEE